MENASVAANVLSEYYSRRKQPDHVTTVISRLSGSCWNINGKRHEPDRRTERAIRNEITKQRLNLFNRDRRSVVDALRTGLDVIERD